MFNFVTAWVDAQWGEWGASPEAAQGTRCPPSPIARPLWQTGPPGGQSGSGPPSLAHPAVGSGDRNSLHLARAASLETSNRVRIGHSSSTSLTTEGTERWPRKSALRIDRRNVVQFELLRAVLAVRQDLDASVRLQAHSHPSRALVRLGSATAILTLHRVSLEDFHCLVSHRETHTSALPCALGSTDGERLVTGAGTSCPADARVTTAATVRVQMVGMDEVSPQQQFARAHASVWAYCLCCDHAQGPLGRPSSPPGSVELRRLPQTPPLGA